MSSTVPGTQNKVHSITELKFCCRRHNKQTNKDVLCSQVLKVLCRIKQAEGTESEEICYFLWQIQYLNAVLGCNLKNDTMISVHFQRKPFNITVIQVYAPTSNAEEAEVERFYEDLQDL